MAAHMNMRNTHTHTHTHTQHLFYCTYVRTFCQPRMLHNTSPLLLPLPSLLLPSPHYSSPSHHYSSPSPQGPTGFQGQAVVGPPGSQGNRGSRGEPGDRGRQGPPGNEARLGTVSSVGVVCGWEGEGGGVHAAS